ncbi:MAG: DNA/RNA non-specific endonuclease [Bacteroidales bacterium]|nr:DNA/RNA non-specific endonuclease [Bacteroidales bacterium]
MRIRKKTKVALLMALIALLAWLIVSFLQSRNESATEPSAEPERPGAWMEIPAFPDSDTSNIYTLYMELDGATVRNYSFLWNAGHLTADWVAYPLYRSSIGQGTRSNSFGLNPAFTEYEQPVLEQAYRRGNDGWYSRGHQIPSGDRLTSYSANLQTFYGTNMTPQDEDLNAGVWESLESKVRQWARRCDTLYVVTGCSYENYEGKYVLDNDGKRVAVPTGYYKALLRLYQGRYYGCAFTFENRPYGEGGYEISWAMPLAKLESHLGIEFFPMLKEKVGEKTYRKIKESDPASDQFWRR